MRRVIAVMGVAALLVAAGCSSDDDDGGGESAATTAEDAEATTTSTEPVGSDEDFCEALEPIQDIDPEDLPTEEDIAQVAAAAAVAPSVELREQTLVIADLGDQLVGIDVEDTEAVQAAQERSLQPEVVDAANGLTAYTEEECGFDVPIFSSLSGTATIDEDGEDEPQVDIDIDQLRDAIAEEDTAAEDSITSVVSVNNEFTLGIIDLTDVDEAIDVCSIASTALADLGAEGATVKVGDTDGNILAEGEAPDECEAA